MIIDSAMLNNKNEPVISLEAGLVSYLTPDKRRLTLTIENIRSVEFDHLNPKHGGGHLILHKKTGGHDKIYVMNLDVVSHKEIFESFKNHLPHLKQRYSTVLRLGEFVIEGRPSIVKDGAQNSWQKRS